VNPTERQPTKFEAGLNWITQTEFFHENLKSKPAEPLIYYIPLVICEQFKSDFSWVTQQKIFPLIELNFLHSVAKPDSVICIGKNSHTQSEY